MSEIELEKINIYLFDRYDKLVVDVNNPSILKQDDNDKRLNIIEHITHLSGGSNTSCLRLSFLLPKYIKNLSLSLKEKKEYYNKYILEDINRTYEQYKIYNKTSVRYDLDDYIAFRFIDKLLKAIKKEEEEKIVKTKKKSTKKVLSLDPMDIEEKTVKTKNKSTKKALPLIFPDLMDIEEKTEKTKKKKSIPATIKRLVWNKNIGEEVGKAKCMCCNVTDITQMSFNCGHIIAEANGGKTIVSNLKPICQNCNSSMSTKNMNEFIKTLK
jgi:hypothetical protein